MPQQPPLSDCQLSTHNGVATLTFQRNDVRNALTSTAIVDDIVATAAYVNAESSISALIITGGGSAFSSGGNVKDMADKAGDFAEQGCALEQAYRTGIQRMPKAIQSIEVPTIAAINGAAIGAGFDLCNMCDIRIASHNAKFGETFVNLGIIPGDGGAWFLQRLIGYQKAAELTFSGRIIDADEAMQLGLLLKIVAQEQLLSETQILAEQFARQPPQALRRSKRLMQMAQRMELDDFLDVCAAFQSLSHQNEEHVEAVDNMLSEMSSK